jgi:hypothetical protein
VGRLLKQQKTRQKDAWHQYSDMHFFDAILLTSTMPAWYNAGSVFNAAHDSITAIL